MHTRLYSPVDQLLIIADKALRTLFGAPLTTGRDNPASALPDASLSAAEQRAAAGLMRENRAGEVAAQALYQGQGLTALDSRTSLLNPLRYAGSFAIGAAAGLAGDKRSLGFVAETERQAARHLDQHLARLPQGDHRSRAILEQMKEEEQQHATTALAAGGAELPAPLKGLMRFTSKVMTTTAYFI